MANDPERIGDLAPFEAAELDALFAPVAPPGERVAIAVSGGSDSVALLVLFAEWLEHTGRPRDLLTALTVDHALRAGSAEEAKQVSALAARLGLAHATLVWAGDKPTTGLAAAAREARYGLLAGYMRAHAIGRLLSAHTRDDQAETVLMRLARGSGIDGLSAMPPVGSLKASFEDLVIARPFLGLSKARLAEALRARGIAWAEDPTNRDLAYERPRLRAAAESLRALGLNEAALAESARRLRRARAALAAMTEHFLAPASGHTRIDPLGFIDISRAALSAEPEEISLRALQWIVQTVGGSPEPVSLGALEALHRSILAEEGDGAWTLGRAAIKLADGVVHCEREPGRRPLPEVDLAPNASIIWDGRFRITSGAILPAECRIGPLGADGLSRAEAAGLARPVGVTAQVLRALPAVWSGDRLVGIPSLAFTTVQDLQPDVAVQFVGMRVPHETRR